MSTSLSYGKELPDQVPGLNAALTHQITLLVDVRELIKERVALEREYAAKISAMAKRAEEKRARHMTPAVLGEECSKAWTDADVRGSTLDKAFTALITSYENTASDHDSLASALSADVGDQLKLLERSKDESRKKQMAFFAKLVGERDRIYGERLKAKQKYDEECLEVEAFRQKQDKAADDKHADRAAKQYDQQKVEMQNRKNAYLVQVAVANNIKDRFYDYELPLLEDQLQSHHADTLRRLAKLLLHSQALQEGHLKSIGRSVASTQTALNALSPEQDQVLYASFNRRPFSKPIDWEFEPCDKYYDTPEVVTEPEPKILLQNKLQRSRAKLAELIPIVEDKSREVARLTKIVGSYAANPTLGNYDEVWENLLEGSHQLTDLELVRATHEAEMKLVAGVLAGDEGAQKPHEFKSTSFSIPAPCGYCKQTRKDLQTLRHFGAYTMRAEDASTRSTAPGMSPVSPSSPIIMASSPPRANSFTRPGATVATSTPTTTSVIQAKVLYSYSASGKFEVSVTVKALYSYEASGADELSLQEGAAYELTPDGENYGDGWWEGVDSKGKKVSVDELFACVLSDEIVV
ncbi:hypothetical protein FRC10_000011 [Ceratobasidium sp. 414]|nr:hypothetical protein FRC10_000011 [Ceratobasidium sp. 414]